MKPFDASLHGVTLVLAITLGCSAADTGSSSTVITAAGGSVTLDTATLVVPPGAVEDSVSITLSSRTAPPSAEGLAVSPRFDFGPDGFQFKKPAILTIELPGYQAVTGKRVVIASWSSQGTMEPLHSRMTGTGVSAALFHFSGYSAEELAACGADCANADDKDCCDLQCVSIGNLEHCSGCAPCAASSDMCCRDFSQSFFLARCLSMTSDDDENCGQCDVNCRDDNTQGRTKCCGGECVDLTNDERHCGACRMACEGSKTCQGGQCVEGCFPNGRGLGPGASVIGCDGYMGTADLTLTNTQPDFSMELKWTVSAGFEPDPSEGDGNFKLTSLIWSFHGYYDLPTRNPPCRTDQNVSGTFAPNPSGNGDSGHFQVLPGPAGPQYMWSIVISNDAKGTQVTNCNDSHTDETTVFPTPTAFLSTREFRDFESDGSAKGTEAVPSGTTTWNFQPIQ